MDKLLYWRIVGTIVRTLLTAFGAWAVTHGIADNDIFTQWIGTTTEILTGLVFVLGSAGWGVLQKFKAHNTVAVTKPNDLGDITTTAVKVTSDQVIRDIH